MLSLKKLSAVLGTSFRLREISFSVGPQERLAVLGPNGSGKSFLLRLILGLATPRSGSIAWEEQVLSGAGKVAVPPEARGMGVVFQDVALFPHLDVWHNVALALPRGVEAKARAERVDRALELARIARLQARSVQSLSGGEQQRVAIARALVFKPRVLLLDEPFHSLDGPLKREVLADVRALVSRERIATIFVTHDTDEAAAFADQIVLLREGRLIQRGEFAHIYARPIDREAAAFLGPVESIERARAEAAAIELPADSETERLDFRREQLELVELANDAAAGLEVTGVQVHGLFRDVSLRLDDGGELVARVGGDAPWRVGQRVKARIAHTLAWAETEEPRP